MKTEKAISRDRRMLSALFGFVLALAMMPSLALATPTSDTDVADSKVTITGLLDGDTVTAYRIADADINAENNLSYVFEEDVPAPYNTIEGLTAIGSDGSAFVQGSDMQKAAGAIAAAFASGNAYTQATATGDSVDLTLGSGYYLVRVTSTSGKARVYQNMVVDVSPVAQDDGTYAPKAEQSLTVKSTPVMVTKGVGENYEDRTDAYYIGQMVPFRVTTAIPSYPIDSLNATFVISDVPAPGLEIDTESIKINDVTAATCDDYTLTASATGYTIVFAKDYILANPGVGIVVTYQAKLTSAAFSHSDTDVTGNTAAVEFNPNPYIDTTVKPDDTTVVQTYGYVFPKTDASGNPLAGAVFTLYHDADCTQPVFGDDGETPLTSTSTIVNGVAYVYFEDLASGTYTAKETTVPAGHLAAPNQTFTLSADACTGDNPATAEVVENNYLVSTVDVVDPDQPTLPVTGGAGTMAVTAAGVVLIAAGALAIRRFRRNDSMQG